MRSIGVSAVLLSALYVACANPPKQYVLPASGGGTGGTGADAGANEGGAAGEAGSSPTAGSGGKGGSGAVSQGGGATEAGAGGSSGSGDAGAGGAAVVVDACLTAVVGGKSTMAAPPTTGVPKPAGTPGNLKVINWAGFKGAVSFTFDDALQSQLDHYTDLNATGVPMTFYLVCANDGNKPGWKTAAQDGHELGNHTMHHCNADGTTCGWGTFTNVDSELDDCTAQLESAFSVPGVYTLASPNGDNAWAAPASTRFLANRGVYDNPAGVAPNDSTNPFNLPCHLAAEGETAVGANGFDAVIDSVSAGGIWRIILNHSLGNNDGYHPVAASEVVAAMTYAKNAETAGDVWADTLLSVAAYWRGQKAVSGVQAVKDGTDLRYSWTLPENFPPGRYLRATVGGGTVKQCGTTLTWDAHGYYEIALDAGSVTISP